MEKSKNRGILFRILVSALMACALVCILPGTQKAGAGTKIPVAVYTSYNNRLTFYYSDLYTPGDNVWVVPSDYSRDDDLLWYSKKEGIKYIYFDESFKVFQPESTANWFSNMDSVIEINGLCNINTEKVTNMESMFGVCTSLQKLDLSGFKTTGVTSMYGMFYACWSLESLDLSGFDTSQVYDMGTMFLGCSALTKVNLSSFKTTNTVFMDAMFDGCRNLQSLDVTGFDTSNLKYASQMFYNCSSLTELDLSGFNTAKLNSASEMFAYCLSLQKIYASSLFTVEKGTDTFYKCKNLVGGAGTTYNEDNIDYTYARIDGGASAPGYFTLKSAGKELSITKQPVNASVNAGTVANFSVTATGTKLSYLWQYKKKGDTSWTSWSTKTTAAITVAYDSSRDGMSLRCKITDGNGKSVYSNTVTLTYKSVPVITKQPVSASVNAGTVANFSVTATGTKLSYLWQYKKKGATSWTSWNTKTTAAITVAYDSSRDGMSLRCKITDGNGKSVYSNTVTLTYKSVPVITKQPVSITVKTGTVANFSVMATGTKLSYLWQYKKKGDTSWTNWTTKTTSSITVAYDKSRDGMSLRCRIKDGNGNTVYTDVVTLKYSKAS